MSFSVIEREVQAVIPPVQEELLVGQQVYNAANVEDVALQNLELGDTPPVPVMVRYGHHRPTTIHFSRGREYTYYVQIPGKNFLEVVSEENYLKHLDFYAPLVRKVEVLKVARS